MYGTENTLIRLSKELNEIFENAATALILVDANVKVVNINRSGIELTGLTKQAVLGKLGGEVMNCVNAWENGKVVCGKGMNCGHCNLRGLVNESYATGRDQYKVEGVLDINHNDEIIRLELQISISLVHINDEKYALITINDITKLKNQERLLIQENEDKDRFISILAHDLKGPFNSLLGFSDLLLENLHEYDLEVIENQLKIINKTTHKTFELLEQILIWAKAQSGKLVFEPQKFSFLEVSTSIISILENQLKAKEIKINVFSAEEIILNTDLNMYKTVLRNLISNAIKFTNKGGTIKVFAKKGVKEITLSVTDNGVGIESNVISKIFEVKEKHTTLGTQNEKGSGFGLKLCKELIEKQGGKIWVESELGRGSSFKFTIPILS